MTVGEPREAGFRVVYLVYGLVREEQSVVVWADEDGGEGPLAQGDGPALYFKAGLEISGYLCCS